MSWRHFDESDVRVRPGRGSRPRTKDRPPHADALVGVVVAVDRGRCTVRLRAGVGGSLLPERRVTAMRARELGRTGVVVGDDVGLVGDTSGRPDSLARIVRIEPRRTVLRRSADDTDPVERVLVANADQLAVVTSLTDPPPRPRLVDRCLVAAYDAGLEPLLVLTKADLVSSEEFLASYAPLAVPWVVTSRRPDRSLVGLEVLRAHLAGRVTVLVGHSGVGKSTLVNALVPGATRSTGAVNDVTGRGRHTSASAVALQLPAGGTRAGRAGRPRSRAGVGHRHPGGAFLRVGARRPRPDRLALPGARAGHRRMPTRVHPRRARVRDRRIRRIGGCRPGRSGAPGLVATPAACPNGRPRLRRTSRLTT